MTNVTCRRRRLARTWARIGDVWPVVHRHHQLVKIPVTEN